MTRRLIIHWGTGSAFLLLAGCFLHLHPSLDKSTVASPPDTVQETTTPAETVLVADTPPLNESTYHAHPPPPIPMTVQRPPEPEVKPIVHEVPRPTPPEEPENALVTAMRCLVKHRPGEATRALASLPEEERARVLALLRLGVACREQKLDTIPQTDLDKALAQLQRLEERLQSLAGLKLPRVCFCRRIQQFGHYDPLPAETSFHAGCDGRPGERVQVYAEVRNFRCRPVTGQYESLLASSLEIRDAQGNCLVTMNLGRNLDRSMTPRRDYFLNFQFHVPARLPPGLYTLWVVVKDLSPGQLDNKQRVARRSLDFKVCAPLR